MEDKIKYTDEDLRDLTEGYKKRPEKKFKKLDVSQRQKIIDLLVSGEDPLIISKELRVDKKEVYKEMKNLGFL